MGCLVFVGVLVFYRGYCVLLFCMGGFVVFVGCVLVVSLARSWFGDVVGSWVFLCLSFEFGSTVFLVGMSCCVGVLVMCC